MNRQIFLVLALAAISVPRLTSAQTVYEYRALRKQNRIVRPVDNSVLDTFVGERVVELQGVIKGDFHTPHGACVLLQRSDGATISVEATTIPQWLENNEIPVRLLVKASRDASGSSLLAVLIGATPEGSVTDEPVQDASSSHAADVKASATKNALTKKAPGRARSRIGSLSSRGGAVRHWVVPASSATPIYADFIRRQNPRLSREEASRIAEGVVGFSIHYGLDPRLIMAVLMVESDFDPSSTSSKGAMGLGQLMPGTAEWMGVHNAYDSVENVYGCVKLIRTHIDQYRKETGRDNDAVVLALAAYNAGIGAVRRSGGVPPYRETQAYVRRVISIYSRLCGR